MKEDLNTFFNNNVADKVKEMVKEREQL